MRFLPIIPQISSTQTCLYIVRLILLHSTDPVNLRAATGFPIFEIKKTVISLNPLTLRISVFRREKSGYCPFITNNIVFYSQTISFFLQTHHHLLLGTNPYTNSIPRPLALFCIVDNLIFPSVSAISI